MDPPPESLSGSIQHFISFYMHKQNEIDEKSMRKNVEAEQEFNEKMKIAEIRTKDIHESFNMLQDYMSPDQSQVIFSHEKPKGSCLAPIAKGFAFLCFEALMIYFMLFYNEE